MYIRGLLCMIFEKLLLFKCCELYDIVPFGKNLSSTMTPWNQLFLLIILVQGLVVAALTDTDDYTALNSLRDNWEHEPPNWSGGDPCGGKWDGIECDNSRIISITLPSLGLSGQLSGDIAGLSELQILDLSYNPGLTGSLPQEIGQLSKLTTLSLVGCGFSGSIPDSIGSLKLLQILSLNMNKFIGPIPPSIGSLENLRWLDLADNKLTGKIPVSNANASGLDRLLHAKHFHLGNNQLSEDIPTKLFSANMSLIHLLLDNNRLTGSIPATLGLVKSLVVVRLDRNSLSGEIPPNITNLSSVTDLYLSNNQLTGSLPDLSNLSLLSYLDVSNNSLGASNISSWFLSLQSLTTLVMENTNLQGEVPQELFSLVQLQSVNLKNNQLSGTLSIGSSYSSELNLIDLQNNSIELFTENSVGYRNIQIVLVGNPIFREGATKTYCLIPRQADSSYSIPVPNCLSPQCMPEQVASPNCACAYPYTGTLYFRAPSFSGLGNSSIYLPLQQQLVFSFQNHPLPVDSVSLSNPSKTLQDYLTLELQVFPSGQDYFSRAAIYGIAFMLSNQTFKPPKPFGPFYFNASEYLYFNGAPSGSNKSSSIGIGIIIGAAVGGCILILLLLLAGVYAFRQKRRAEIANKQIDPFASWDPTKNSGGVPQLKGARNFTFEELKKYTNNFSEANDIGCGGYGKVYRGILPNGQLVAIKRAQQGSMQGGLEFKTEIELLSRVHHKNVVSLVGFCFDQDEEMLIYEFIPNGTLKDSLSGKTGIKLDWMRRLRIALGAARGIQYLHVLANPPIIHRDIKSNNVLLDDRLNAKVADFGLSKPVGSPDRTHVTTQVKGTMGYMDPEYYMTNQLTEKSDVYGFGVLLLELITARPPIEKGKYIVREVKQAMDKTKELYNLHGIIDPLIVSSDAPGSLEKFVDLALSCVQEEGVRRPTMSEVVKEIESIMELAGLNPHAESASTSESYEGVKKGYQHPYSDDSLFVYSGPYPRPNVEPK